MWILFFSKLYKLKGRSCRKEYIARLLLTIVVCLIWTYSVDSIKEVSIYTVLYKLILLCAMVTMLFQYFPLSVRRLHDLNSSGWYVFLTFVPFCQFFILWLMFKEGTEGTNRYGEQPKN